MRPSAPPACCCSGCSTRVCSRSELPATEPPLPQSCHDLAKIESLGKSFASLVIPVVLLVVGQDFAAATQQREIETRFVEVATAILNMDPGEKPSAEVQSLRRGGSCRSVALYTDRSAAEEALGKARVARADNCLVDMNKWCPTAVDREGFRECDAP
jgi:hypothetical protein